MKILILGLGNPILGDDGVGWHVAEILRLKYEKMTSRPEIDFISTGGLSLMERMLGYQQVVLIDTLETGKNPVGKVTVFPLNALDDPMAGHSTAAHDTSLMTALQTAQAMGAEIPSRVDVVAIEAMHVYDFSEELSPPVAAAIPDAVEQVMNLVQEMV